MKRHIVNNITIDETAGNRLKRQKCLANAETKSSPNTKLSNDTVSTALKRSLSIDDNSSEEGSPKRSRKNSPSTIDILPIESLQTEIFKTSEVSKEQIAANISMELKRLQRRRQLHYQRTNSPPPQEAGSSQSCTSLLSQNSLSPSKKDAPLFTFKQVTMICERMLKDRESQVREEYNSVLSSKLAEQYEAFLKFNLDMIHKSLVDSPFSYIS